MSRSSPEEIDYLDVAVTVCVHMGHAPGLVGLSSAAPKHDKGFHYQCLLGVLVAQCGSFNIIIFLLYLLRKNCFPHFYRSTEVFHPPPQHLFYCFHNITKIQRYTKQSHVLNEHANMHVASSLLGFNFMRTLYRRETE